MAIQHTYNGTSRYYNIYGAHNKPTAADIQAGTFAGKVVANTAAISVNNTAQIRNTYISPNDIVAGTSQMTTGNIYLIYE